MEVEKIGVRLEGLSHIMFDRFIDHSAEMRPPEQKFYLFGENQVVLPADNIIYFLFSENPPGCAKAFEGKQGKTYVQIGLGHVFIDPISIPFIKNDEPVIFDQFDNKCFQAYLAAGRTKKGTLSIKQEIKARPVLMQPWSLEFKITIIKNSHIDETKLYNWFVNGGFRIGLGTYRPRFGRFEVGKWEKISN